MFCDMIDEVVLHQLLERMCTHLMLLQVQLIENVRMVIKINVYHEHLHEAHTQKQNIVGYVHERMDEAILVYVLHLEKGHENVRMVHIMIVWLELL
jgi:hypothetical protein